MDAAAGTVQERGVNVSLETAIHCDGCGETLCWRKVISKATIVAVAREYGWSIGKYHLCPQCKKLKSKLIKEGRIK